MTEPRSVTESRSVIQPCRSVGDPLLDAVLDYGEHTARCAEAFARGRPEQAGAAQRAALSSFAEIMALVEGRAGGER